MPKQEEFPSIRTRRLVLTLPAIDTAPRLLDYVVENREHHAPWSPPLPEKFFTEKYWRDRLRWAREEFRRSESLRLVIFRRNDSGGRVVGTCNFTNFIRGPFQACYLGYLLDKDAVGKGMMYEALTAAIRYLFNELQMHRVMANYMPRNERSGRLLRRLGFTVEGYARDYLLIAGNWEDHVLTALTNTKLEPADVR